MTKALLGRAGKLLLIALISNTGTAAYALQPLITDDTATQGKGAHQLEFAYTHDRIKSGTDHDRQQSIPIVYTFGLGDPLDLFVELNLTRIHTGATDTDAAGLSNTTLGAKWRIHENEATKTSVALKPQLLLPQSSRREKAGLGNGNTSGDLTVIVTQELPFGALHINLGAGIARYRDQTENPNTVTQRISTAPVWAIDEHFKLVSDLGLEWSKERGSSRHQRDKFRQCNRFSVKTSA